MEDTSQKPAKTIRDHVSTILDWWVLALAIAAVVAAAYCYHKLQEVPLYKSTAVVMFEPPSMEVGLTGLGGGGQTLWEATLTNNMTDLHSGQFLTMVVDSFNETERKVLLRGYEMEAEVPTIGDIIRRSSNFHRRSTNIFMIEFNHRDPEAAALLANRYSEIYGDFLMKRKQESSESAVRFLKRQSEELRVRVERGELALQQFRQERDLVSLEENQNLILEKMKSISGALNQNKLELLNLESNWEGVQKMRESGENLWMHPSVRGYGSLQSKLETLTALQTQKKVLSERYGKRHPKMVQGETMIAATEDEIQSVTASAVEFLASQLSAQKKAVAELSTALAAAEKDMLELDRIRIEYDVLRRKLDIDRSEFAKMLQRLNEAQVAGELVSAQMRLIERAWPASVPFTPNRKKILATSGFLFIALFAALPFAFDFAAGRLKSRFQVEQLLHRRFLGSVMKVRGKKGVKLHELSRSNEIPQVTEQFRAILSHLLLSTGKQSPIVLAITSLVAREGKTMVTSNLGLTFAQHRHRVLLIDCDLRRPGLSSTLKITDKEGLVQLSEMEAEERTRKLDELILPLAPNLDVLPAGRDTDAATEILHSEFFNDIVDWAKGRYDTVIIDTPPMTIFPDAISLAPYVDGYIFLTRHRKHRMTEVKDALKRIDDAGANLFGFVFTMARHTRRNRYYTGDYKYKYGGYGSPKSAVQPPAKRKEPDAPVAASVSHPEVGAGR